ncbi:MAG: hypothetical protein P4K86_09825 [Terracidiphilus sp.]|nr:hypothetical protein [Terracidiphilus sp.]
MNAYDQDRMKKLLQQALPPMEGDPEPGRDLWPGVLGRMEARPATLPWFDWALLAGLAALAAFFPASIPLFLYYL